MKAVVKSLKGIIVTLQHLHQESGDLSSEVGGLLLTFQDRKSVILQFSVKDILDTVCKLALQVQHYNAALCDVPDLLKTVIGQMKYPAKKSTVQVLQILFRNVHFLFWIVPNILIKKSTKV